MHSPKKISFLCPSFEVFFLLRTIYNLCEGRGFKRTKQTYYAKKHYTYSGGEIISDFRFWWSKARCWAWAVNSITSPVWSAFLIFQGIDSIFQLLVGVGILAGCVCCCCCKTSGKNICWCCGGKKWADGGLLHNINNIIIIYLFSFIWGLSELTACYILWLYCNVLIHRIQLIQICVHGDRIYYFTDSTLFTFLQDGSTLPKSDPNVWIDKQTYCDVNFVPCLDCALTHIFIYFYIKTVFL